MQPEPDLATTAALIGDPTRAAILSALMGGRALPATELAYAAHITPQTASAHLHKLVDGGVLAVTTSGRHRYYRIRSDEVAHALEALARIAPPPPLRTRKQSADYDTLRHGRTCYDHLAGRLGVAVTRALVGRGLLAEGDAHFTLTDAGRGWLASLDIDADALRRNRRRFASACLDWSEREYHVAGAVGAAIASQFLEREWIVRLPDTRAVRLTGAGQAALNTQLGLDLTPEQIQQPA